MEKTILDHIMYVKEHQIKQEYKSDYERIKAIKHNQCQRCGAPVTTTICSNCKELGILTIDDYLYRIKGDFSPLIYSDSLEELILTPLQQEASQFLLDCFAKQKNSLIWAVCGAGKTEITFEVIFEAITSGKLVCFCIPRRDILKEIKERVEKYFPNIITSLVTGEIKENKNAHIYLVTANQLLRFKGVFDLVIIDEIDAFPFSSNEKFLKGLKEALNKTGVFIALTSTPSEEIKTLKLETFIIYKRWHNYLLAEPKLRILPQNKKIYKLILMYHLKKFKRQMLIFVCNTAQTTLVATTLSKLYGNLIIEGVSSKSKNRKNIIEKFRKNEINVLVTTPILERGVTFKDVEVIVLDADNSLYNEASLVQIAGRARRHPDYQKGKVYFYYNELTSTIKAADTQIKEMNKRARENMLK